MNQAVVIKDRSALLLLQLLASNSEQAQEILTYFAAYCDCDVREWIVARVTANDQVVINKIKAVLAYNDPDALIRGPNYPVFDQLTHTYCEGQNLMGLYASGAGATVNKLILEGAEECVPPPKTVSLYFPFATSATEVNAGSDAVEFSTSPFYEDGISNLITSQKIFDTNPRIPRLQVKFDNLEGGSWDDVVVELRAPRNANGDYEGDINLMVPYTPQTNTWSEPGPTMDYDPVTRICKLETTLNGNGNNQYGGSSYLCVVLNGRVVGYVEVSGHRFDYDASTSQPDKFKTFIMNAQPYYDYGA